MTAPQPETSVYWRMKSHAHKPWQFGYVNYIGIDTIRMGRWHGDRTTGPIVLASEIEWKEYK